MAAVPTHSSTLNNTNILADKDEVKIHRQMLIDGGADKEIVDQINHSVGYYSRLLTCAKPLIHNYPSRKLDVITTCYKVVFNTGEKDIEVIFGYSHSTCSIALKSKIEESDYTKIIENIHHEYVCYSSTFVSSDGEFRNRLTSYKQVLDIYNIFYESAFKEIEEATIRKIKIGKIVFNFNVYMNEKYYQIKKLFLDAINDLRMPIKLFCVCWFIDYHRIATGTAENHMSENYKILFSQKKDKALYLSIKERLGDAYIRVVDALSRNFPTEITERNIIKTPRPALGVGQKIIPLLFKNARPDEVDVRVWGELQLQHDVSDAVINAKCPGFSILGDWFYIFDADISIYENASMRQHFASTVDFVKMFEDMRSIYKRCLVDPNDKVEVFKNDHFRALAANLLAIGRYFLNIISYIPLAMCYMSEYVDKTLGDIIIMSNNLSDSFIHTLYKNLLSDRKLFDKLLFEMLYTLGFMNNELDFMHGDLHINNSCMRLFKAEEIAKLDSPTIIYNYNGDKYIFPHQGMFLTIIDFSRSSSSRSKRRGQTLPLLEAIKYAVVNEYPKLKEIIIGSHYILHPDAALRLFSLYDVIRFTAGIRELLKGASITAHNEIINKLHKEAEEGLFGEFKVYEENRAGYATNLRDWPINKIIKDNFSQYLYSGGPVGTLCDYYSTKSTLNYSLYDLAKLPPFITADEKFSKWSQYKVQFEEKDLENAIKKYDQYDDINKWTKNF